MNMKYRKMSSEVMGKEQGLWYHGDDPFLLQRLREGWSGSTERLRCAGRGRKHLCSEADALQVAFSWCAACCHTGWRCARALRVTAVDWGSP